VLVNMPVPVFDISDLLKNEKPESALQVQQVVLHISEYIARNQSPKSKFAQGEDFSQHISLMVPTPTVCRVSCACACAVSRVSCRVVSCVRFALKLKCDGWGQQGTGAQEEVQKLRQRIRAGQEEFTPGQAAVLKDAEENDNRIAAMQRIQDEVQQALADEVASKLGQFASQLVPFLASTHDQLIDRVVDQVKEYKVPNSFSLSLFSFDFVFIFVFNSSFIYYCCNLKNVMGAESRVSRRAQWRS
jgi:hypothetical protein